MLSLQHMRPPWEELEPASQSALQRQRQAVRDLSHLSSIVFVAVTTVVAVHTTNLVWSASSTTLTFSEAILSSWPALITILLSLLVLFTLWILHHLQLHYLTQVDGTLLVLHVILFSATVFLSVSAAWVNTTEAARSSVAVYAGNVFAIQMLLLLVWRHAVRAGLLFGSDVPSRVVARLRTLLQFGTAGSLLVAGLAFAGATAGFVGLALLLLIQLSLIGRGGYALKFGRDIGRMTE